MKHISSRDNPAVKALVKLAGTAGKRGAPVLLDGVHLCQAWLQHHGAPDQAIFDVERLAQPDIAALAAAVPDARCLALDARLMQALASVESGQGVAFVVTPPPLSLPAAVDENCVLFDRIQDPGNVGTLLRTCAAAGIKRVFLATGTAAAWSPKVLRSGQGGAFRAGDPRARGPVGPAARAGGAAGGDRPGRRAGPLCGTPARALRLGLRP